MYDPSSSESIIRFAKKLKNQTLRRACSEKIEKHGYKGKGNFGQILEKFYFGYKPNSDAEPDFPKAKVELKSSPLKTLKNGAFRSKERLVLNIINYLEVHKEEFYGSSFWKKNAHLLVVFYLHDKELDLLDYIIKLVDEWKYPDVDLKIIKRDWMLINQKIKDGKAHELSEGDTFYLGACTKGSTALKSLRDQPFNEAKAKQRAYSLKQGYVNHIIANIAQEEEGTYGKIIDNVALIDEVNSIEDIVISKFHPFYGKTAAQIQQELGFDLNSGNKSYCANLTKAVLGIELGQKIEEFEKADIQVKTVRLKESLLPDQHISFPAFKYEELVEENWDESQFKKILESKFFFVFYLKENNNEVVQKVKFWNMPYADILESRFVWRRTKRLVSRGRIVKSVKDSGVKKIRKVHFPKSTEHRICHVRPHAQSTTDTYDLPVPDELTGVKEYTKHSFWLNASYIKKEVYEK